MSTALEIFTQPDDLYFVVGEKDNKWGFAIMRGPGHRFKLLITSELTMASAEAAIEALEQLLERICSSVTRALNDPSSIIAKVLNPSNEPLDNANVLSVEYRERISRDLRSSNKAETYTYKKPA